MGSGGASGLGWIVAGARPLHFSLIGGVFPWAVVAVAVVALTATVVWPEPGWAWRLLRLGLFSGAAMAVVAIAVARLRVFDFTYPRSFYVWVGLVVFAAGVARAGWPAFGWRRRAMSLLAVLATVAMAGTLVNLHYGYYPTPAAVLGQLAAHEVSPRHLFQQAAGALPSPAHGGEVVTVDIPATVSGFPHRPSLVYLPPAWFDRPRPALPVILMLSGTPGLTSDWTRAGGADRTADAYAATHSGWAPILVLADSNGSDTGDTECVDGRRGKAETYLTVDVPAYVVKAFGAPPARWGVAGLSEGGTCAIMLALRHPTTFGTFADFAGDFTPTLGSKEATVRGLYGGSQAQWKAHDPLTLLSRTQYHDLAGWFEVGTADSRPLAAAIGLEAASRAAGITTKLIERPGLHHNFLFWSSALQDAFPWMADRLSSSAPSRKDSTITPPTASAQ